MLVSGEGPPDFYVPQPSIVDLAVSHFGPARGEAAATIRPVRYAGIRDARPSDGRLQVSGSRTPSSSRSTLPRIALEAVRSSSHGTRARSVLHVSGDAPVVLVADVGSVPHRAIARLAQLGPELPPFALIGGLAVIARLGQAHRATNDVDTVSDDQAGLVGVLVSAGFHRQGDSVLLEPTSSST